MKIEHQLFAHHYILSGDRDKAYKIAYPTASGEPQKNAARRLINKPEVRDYINTRMAEVQQQTAKDYHDEQKRREEQEYATLLLKRKVLRQMIDGEHKQLRHFKFKNHVETIEESLAPFAILRAIELDTKLAAEWFSRNGKVAEQVKPSVEKKEYKGISLDEVCTHKYGPDYMPAMRARIVRDNPRMAAEFARDGLRVLDHVPDLAEYKRMEQEQQQRLEKLAEEYDKIRPETEQEDPPGLPDAYPVPEAVPVNRPATPVKATHIVPPPGVNPMSVPPPESRLQLSKEEVQQRLQQSYEQLSRNPESMFYLGNPSQTPQNNTG